MFYLEETSAEDIQILIQTLAVSQSKTLLQSNSK